MGWKRPGGAQATLSWDALAILVDVPGFYGLSRPHTTAIPMFAAPERIAG